MSDDKMKIGDEVAFHWEDGRPDTVVVITHIGYDGLIDGMDAKGTLYASKNPQKWTKTGRYFPLVTQLLRQMSGEKLPPAQPQRTGRWWHYEGHLTCSECETEYYDDIIEYCGDDVPRFCPHCGARMEDNNESD